ncbi:hypothetical protein [Dyadobacter frigoris]|uniref:Uncharacterized protein n=1 Tax=Dyadobacter frigoris TaxID=2576211 RepID=A0A4U6CZL7_9BACT|nr:hypothetical protein [Dyadobacter frigoris]TKT86914.1 hypothetical protein FDK13_31190 [Dyadobacter frigoris]GLU56582.1 hypothetical protein Dfri01_60430 [Dyadobacter frigoris]
MIKLDKLNQTSPLQIPPDILKSLLKYLVFTALTAFSFSCTKENEGLNVEREVFATLLPNLVDSVYKDPELYLNPPLLQGYQQMHSTSRENGISAKSSQEIVKTEKVIKKIDVSVSTAIKPISDQDTKTVNMLIKRNGLKIRLNKNLTSHKLDLTTIQDKRYHFKSLAESALEKNLTTENGKTIYHVGLAFSRIQFDENMENGILNGTYLCYPKCGIGYVILVHKTANGWKIQKVFLDWLS